MLFAAGMSLLTVTGLSVVVALLIGTVEILGLLVGPFFATWAVALLVWKAGRIEERWTASPAERSAD